MKKRFWAGLLGGTVFGLLFAKKSGKEVRSELTEAGKQGGWQSALKQLGKELGDIGEEFMGALHEVEENPSVQEAVTKAKKQVKKGVAKAQKKVARAAKKRFR